MITVNAELCTRCGQCLRVCAAEIIEMRDGIPAMTATGEDDCILCQHCLAVCPAGAITLNDKTPADCAPAGPLPSPEHMLNLLRQRRSIRRFQATPIEPAILAKLQAALAWSPTGCNDHRLYAVLVNGHDAMARFREPTLRLLRWIVKTRIPQLINRKLNRVLKNILDGEDVIFRQAPHMIVVATPKKAPCADIDPTIALAEFELYAQTFGLGTLWCGFALFAFRIFRHLRRPLALPKGYRVGGVILFGYPDVTYHRATSPDPIQATTITAAAPSDALRNDQKRPRKNDSPPRTHVFRNSAAPSWHPSPPFCENTPRMLERRPSSRKNVLALLMVGLAGPAAFLFAWLASQHLSVLPSWCPLLNLAAMPCPSCGLTRALAALLHGDLAVAMQWHAFAPLILALALAAWIWILGRLTAPHAFPALPPWWRRRRVWVTALAIFSAYYLLRISGCCPVPDGYFPPSSQTGTASRPSPVLPDRDPLPAPPR